MMFDSLFTTTLSLSGRKSELTGSPLKEIRTTPALVLFFNSSSQGTVYPISFSALLGTQSVFLIGSTSNRAS